MKLLTKQFRVAHNKGDTVMKKAILILFVFFAAHSVAAPASGNEKTISILFVKSERDIDLAAAQTIQLIKQNLEEYSSIDTRIHTCTVEQEFFKSYHEKGEQSISGLMAEYSCDYLIFMRKVDKQHRCFEVWSEDMVLENIYIPVNEYLENFLPDFSANAFLSLLYDMEKQFWKARLY